MELAGIEPTIREVHIGFNLKRNLAQSLVSILDKQYIMTFSKKIKNYFFLLAYRLTTLPALVAAGALNDPAPSQR